MRSRRSSASTLKKALEGEGSGPTKQDYPRNPERPRRRTKARQDRRCLDDAMAMAYGLLFWKRPTNQETLFSGRKNAGKGYFLDKKHPNRNQNLPIPLKMTENAT